MQLVTTHWLMPNLSPSSDWYVTTDISFFSIPLVEECRSQFAFTWKGGQYAWNCPRDGNTALPSAMDWSSLHWNRVEPQKSEIHWWYYCAVLYSSLWEGEENSLNPSESRFAIEQSKVTEPAWENQFLERKQQYGHCQMPVDQWMRPIKQQLCLQHLANKETPAFSGTVSFWRMHIPNYGLIVSPLYQVTQKKNNFKWGPEQWKAFEKNQTGDR